MNGTDITCAFVSTNSITQGEQVVLLWEHLYEEYKIIINFGYRSFIWNSETSDKAQIHCVIVGYSQVDTKNKYLYLNERLVKKVDYINACLVEAPMVFIKRKMKPLKDIEPIVFGSMANDGGYLILNNDEREKLIKEFPQSKKFIRMFLGAREFLNDLDRWCLWIEPNDLKEIQKIKPIMMRTENLLEARSKYPDWSLAELYNELTMPPELRKAHQSNDAAVMEAYGFDWRTMTESECVAELMKMYEELTK